MPPKSPPHQPLPRWVEPMLATLTDRRFSDPQWQFERKYDGYRALAFIEQGAVRLLTRNQNSLNADFPALAEALGKQPSKSLILDGEIVATGVSGSEFTALSRRKSQKSPIEVCYFVFDILSHNGTLTTGLALTKRRALLVKTLKKSPLIQLAEVQLGEGLAALALACSAGWEGLIAKDTESLYVHRRSDRWLKFKCDNRQEFVIGGFTDPQGSRTGFGALLLGYYSDEGKLLYAGKVGTGFSDRDLAALAAQLKNLERKTPPFVKGELPEARWVTPRLVCEVQFMEWTDEGHLRHPGFRGLRTDKAPTAVQRDRGG